MTVSPEKKVTQSEVAATGSASDHKDWWDKLRVVGGAAIPLVLAVVGWQVNATLNERELNVQYVRLAIEILQSRDSSEATNQLRYWALDILTSHSPVAMPAGLRTAIEKGQVQLPNPYGGVTTRLDIALEQDMSAVLDGDRRAGPGAAGWVTRVAPGVHKIEWFGPGNALLCAYNTTEGAQSLILSCDRRTGQVTVREGS